MYDIFSTYTHVPGSGSIHNLTVAPSYRELLVLLVYLTWYCPGHSWLSRLLPLGSALSFGSRLGSPQSSWRYIFCLNNIFEVWYVVQKDANNDERMEKGKRCAVEGCNIFSWTGCSGHCFAHATQAQKDTNNDERKEKGKKCAVKGCDKFPQTGFTGHCSSHATQEQLDAINDERKEMRKRCATECCDKFPRAGCSGHCLAHATQLQKYAINDEK